jgi:hypothetical protein
MVKLTVKEMHERENWIDEQIAEIAKFDANGAAYWVSERNKEYVKNDEGEKVSLCALLHEHVTTRYIMSERNLFS